MGTRTPGRSDRTNSAVERSVVRPGPMSKASLPLEKLDDPRQGLFRHGAGGRPGQGFGHELGHGPGQARKRVGRGGHGDQSGPGLESGFTGQGRRAGFPTEPHTASTWP